MTERFCRSSSADPKKRKGLVIFTTVLEVRSNNRRKRRRGRTSAHRTTRPTHNETKRRRTERTREWAIAFLASRHVNFRSFQYPAKSGRTSKRAATSHTHTLTLTTTPHPCTRPQAKGAARWAGRGAKCGLLHVGLRVGATRTTPAQLLLPRPQQQEA